MSMQDTKYADLDSTLKAVGKAVFVKFYYDFKDISIPIDALAEKIYRENPRAKSKQQRFRIPRARHIFEENQQLQALELIISSPRVDEESRVLAAEILNSEEYALRFEAEKLEEDNVLNVLNRSFIYEEPANLTYDSSPQKPKEISTATYTHYPRNRHVAANALHMAKYLCEADPKHYVFRRKNSEMTYTEPHHLVPLSAQKFFPNTNLDREQNIVSLCSNCHNCLHYGAEIDMILKPLYEKRKDLLEAIGIDITYEQLKMYYL